MAKIAFIFPGQGSQSVGMGMDAAQHSPQAKALVEKTDNILGYPLAKMMAEGPEEDLKNTENTQPALYVASAATLQILSEAGIEPYAVAGHSLGEYSALYAAGVFNFERGLKLVKIRGHAFAEAGKKRPGAMAAIVGLEGAKVAAICEGLGSDDSIVEAANYNDPTQTVISGDPPAVEKAMEECKEAGARRALALPVSGAFHSPLVAPAGATMKTALFDEELAAPQCHFVNNVDADSITDPKRILDGLVAQVTSSVRWVECVQKLVELGCDTFVEVGSGKVLSGLVRRIDKSVTCHTTENGDAISKTIDALKAS